MGKRIVLRIETNRKDVDALQAFLGQVGMTQVAALSRLVEWFAEQDEVVKATIMGQMPEDLKPRDIAKIVLERMVK